MNKIKKVISISICSVFLNTSINAQQVANNNLINNSSFEIYEFCPKYYLSKKKFLPYWYSPTKGTPDYYNACSNYKAGVPENSVGFANAKNGNGYIGIGLVNNPHFLFSKNIYLREYVSTKLTYELIEGELYCFKMNLSLADYSKYVTDEISVYFSKKKPRKRTNLHLPYQPQIIFNDKMMDNDTAWVELKAFYKAEGDEKYITIGNFESQREVNWVERDMKHLRKNIICDGAYYYIDDIVLYPINSNRNMEKDFTF